jgi:hypothetical protein
MTPPATPLNLRVTDWGSDFIALAWDPVSGDPTMYAYDLYRSEISGTLGLKLARVLDPTTVYTDTAVAGGTTYYYHVQALDSSFNRSGYSNQAQGTAAPKVVATTFRVRVPDYTPGTVYIAGNLPGWPQWNPGAMPMTEVAPHIWEITVNIPDGTAGEYKYTRGDWDKVESWGTIVGLANRHVTVSYGLSGVQLVDDTATDWGTGPDDHKAVRDWFDPIVVSFNPADGAANVPLSSTISVTWSHAMAANTDFQVDGPGGAVSGSFGYDPASFTVTFTPTLPLAANGVYTVLVTGEIDDRGGSQQVPVQWSFSVVSPAVSFAQPAVTVDEAVGSALLTVTLDMASAITVTVDYASSDLSATAGSDYTAVSGTLTFAPGVTSQTISVPILDDIAFEAHETLAVSLSNPAGLSMGYPGVMHVSIVSDDLFKVYLPFAHWQMKP